MTDEVKLHEMIVDIENELYRTLPYHTDAFRIEQTVSRLLANGVTFQKHGHWEFRLVCKNGVAEQKAVCSLCGEPNKQYTPPYCPHCGAYMRGDKHG